MSKSTVCYKNVWNEGYVQRICKILAADELSPTKSDNPIVKWVARTKIHAFSFGRLRFYHILFRALHTAEIEEAAFLFHRRTATFLLLLLRLLLLWVENVMEGMSWKECSERNLPDDALHIRRTLCNER